MNINARGAVSGEPLYPICWPAGVGWYVARTNIKCEFRAEMGLRSKGYEVFLPREKVWVRHARRKSERERPLFGRYLFVGFDPNLMPWTPIKETDGIECLVMNNGIPSRLPAGLVEKLRGEIEVGCFDETKAVAKLEPGDEIRITEGPFADFVGKLKVALPKKRVEMLLNLLGGDVCVTIPLAWVRPVE
ncbi:MAG TPA: transcription termination/antitermination NusG family protein [Pseudolabrys sp.]|nr:transcription termination/antitermination NusG family protein [Pseudolabrys sp.]